MKRWPVLILVLALTAGCAHFPVNDPLDEWQDGDGYNFDGWDDGRGDVFVAVSLSGGGARAAAFSFGVLEAMQRTRIGANGSLLDEVDLVSSISGGSITAAYWAAHGRDALFAEFPADFLEKDIESALTWRILSPANWFRLMGETYERVDLVAEYLDEELFDDTRFADVRDNGGPFFLINATDASWGTRFDFTQDSFSQMCSDLDTYLLSRAVAASGAVPVASSPISLRNYGWACGFEPPDWYAEPERIDTRRRLRQARALDSYGDTVRMREWTHLVDGGIVGNLGINGLFDVAFPIEDCAIVDAPRHVVAIVVDAVLELDHCPDYSIDGPDLSQTISAVVNITIDRLSDQNADRLESHLRTWADTCTAGDPPDIHTLFVRIPAVDDPDMHDRLQAGTGLSLPCETVDALRCAGRNVFDTEARALIEPLAAEPQRSSDALISDRSSCAAPDRVRQLDCDAIVPSAEAFALNHDTRSRCEDR